MSRFLIYALVDPRTLLVRYVGQSSTGMRRPREHACPSRLKKRTHTASWVASLIKAGFRYRIAILETVENVDRLSDCETWWLAYGRALGWNLTNHAPAGGTVRGLVRSAQYRAKQSASQRGKVLSPEHRAAIGAGLTGRLVSEETKAKLRAKHLGRVMSPESRAKMSASALKRPPRGPKSATTRAKLSAAFKGRPLAEATKAKISIILRQPPRLRINLLPGR